MRVYGRVPVPFPPSGQESSADLQYGHYKWVVIETDDEGHDDYVYITALIQVLRLNLGESPFWATFGIPAKTSVIQQTHPDYYVAYTQTFFSQYFASLIISKLPTVPNGIGPTYRINIIRNNGSKFQKDVGI